jgi:hypothetical protein
MSSEVVGTIFILIIIAIGVGLTVLGWHLGKKINESKRRYEIEVGMRRQLIDSRLHREAAQNILRKSGN